ncbi:hypothetical protein NLJ89_g11056 [Agrocybe chaxingu]|uniref:AB hydrolase-1 domain-containing protein n=1 Tax=Agrocybe chaxingu TaxID=84603 RepID=A0A9W8JPG0_9AGAR|nr:hypothetical protein NLJ89_g11056 [Agrocybe chaxingu]
MRSEPSWTRTHALSIHVLPAAFPRAGTSPGGVPEVPPPEAFKNKAERVKWMGELSERMVWEKGQSDGPFPDAKAGIRVEEKGLWSVVLRIRRKEGVKGTGRKGVTLIATHPIGFHKETWGPLFELLIQFTESESSPIRIEEIWSLDAFNHGDAALINGSYLPRLPDRSDYGRDLANFLLHHLPDSVDTLGKDLPFHLLRLASATTSARIKNGFTDRTLVALGHSLGGDATAICGISYPKLFSALILMETTLFPPSRNSPKRRTTIILGTMGRRSWWDSREEAKKALLKSPLFQAFDPAVFDAYVEHGMYQDDKTGKVHLKCPPAAEASEYTESRTMNEGWELLPTLDDSVELRWVMGGTDEASNLVGGRDIARLTVWRRPTNASNVRIPGGGHLIVQEKPREVAEDIALFLSHKYSSNGEDKKRKSKM